MPERRKLETILLENKLVSIEQLKQIANYAYAVGIDLHEAVLQKKIASPDAVMMAYAESIGFPFIRLADVSFDEEVTLQVDPMTARQHSFVPISIDHGHVLLATTKPITPDIADELRMIFNLPVRCMICTPAELNAAIAERYPRGASRVIKIEQPKSPQPEAKKTVAKTMVKTAAKKPEPISDEEQKDILMKSVVAFNFSFAFVCFALYYLQILRGISNTWYYFPVLILIGAIVGGLVTFVTWKKLRYQNRDRTQG